MDAKIDNAVNKLAFTVLCPMILFVFGSKIKDIIYVIKDINIPLTNSYPNIMNSMSDTMLYIITNAISVFFVSIIVFLCSV